MDRLRTLSMLALVASLCAPRVAAGPVEQRREIDGFTKATLKLVAREGAPALRDAVNAAYAYAVFGISQDWNELGEDPAVADGYGVAVRLGSRTYMELGFPEPGARGDDRQLLVLFETQEAFEDFIDGWEAGGEQQLAGRAGIASDGGYVNGIRVLQVVDGQFAPRAEIAGSRYRPVPQLNGD